MSDYMIRATAASKEKTAQLDFSETMPNYFNYIISFNSSGVKTYLELQN